MSIKRSDNKAEMHPKPVQDGERKLAGAVWVDYASTAEITAAILPDYRRNKYYWVNGILLHCDNDAVTFRTIGGSGGGGPVTIYQVIQLKVGDPTAANPPGTETPAAGAVTVVLPYKVVIDSELIFYQGFPVYKAPSPDFNYTPVYETAATTYTFSQQLTEGFVLKFNLAITL